MSIRYIKGNLFTSKSQTLANTINCVGVMGAGIALEFKYRYPKMFEEYVKLCDDKIIKIGTLWLYRKEPDRKWVLNFPTKQHWKFESKPEYLIKGLEKFVETYREKGIQSIAFPLLGADKGGLNPELSKEIMEKYLSQCDIPIEIYEFDPYAEDDLIHTIQNLFTRNAKDIAKTIDATPAVINKIKKVLEKNNINSLSQLGRVKGIGETTLEKLYQAVIYQPKRPKTIAPELFDLPQELNEPEINLKPAKKEKTIDETETINAIIKSFNDFGLGDIKYNSNKPIAAFILCACFIDQLAVYGFKDKSSEHRWEKFIEKYLPKYDGLKLYSTFRCYLVHEYSLRGRYKITSDTPEFKVDSSYTNITFIHIPTFINELEEAFLKFVMDLKTDVELKKNALKWEKRHPIIKAFNYNPTSYSENEADSLINYFTPLIATRRLDNRDDLSFSKIIKELQPNGQYLIFVTWTGKKSQKYCMELQDAIKHLQLPNKVNTVMNS